MRFFKWNLILIAQLSRNDLKEICVVHKSYFNNLIVKMSGRFCVFCWVWSKLNEFFDWGFFIAALKPFLLPRHPEQKILDFYAFKPHFGTTQFERIDFYSILKFSTRELTRKSPTVPTHFLILCNTRSQN